MMTCQCGVERFLKQEIIERYHDLRTAFSKPGFVTFKATPEWDAQRVSEIRSVFARYKGISFGRMPYLREEPMLKMAGESAWMVTMDRPRDLRVNRIHVFPRDHTVPGNFGFEPHIDDYCRKIHNTIYLHCPFREKLAAGADDPLCPAERKETVLDIIPVSGIDWYIGFHIANDWRSCQPGGIVDLQQPIDMISRAFFKFEEGLRWSGFPVPAGSHWLDIGAAPGGASQALLARGAEVIGVDPAEISPDLMNHPNFCHLRGRLNQLKRSLFRKIRWVITDMNVAPKYTLDVLEELNLRRDINIRGLLFTLKLVKWDLVADIPKYVQRIKSWGYTKIAIAQMQFNRQEIMVAVKK